jgi:hypothetical protein
MIDQGTDGLSRGLWMSPERHLDSSVMEAQRVLRAVPFNPRLACWTLDRIGLPTTTKYRHITKLNDWNFKNIHAQLSFWTPTPELARQAIRTFLDA